MSDSTVTKPGPDAQYQKALADGELRLQYCASCACYVFPPRYMCPGCGTADLSWRAISGAGTVYSTTVVRQKPELGGDYNIALIDLAEGPRQMGRVEGVPPTEVRIGMAVRARIATGPAGPLLVFDPA